MAQRSSADVTFFITDNDTVTNGDVLATLPGVLQCNGVGVRQLTEEGYAFGDAFVFFVAVGISQADDVSLTLFFDDTPTTGAFALFASGTTKYRTFKVRYGGTTPNRLYQSMDVIVENLRIAADKGGKLKIEVNLKPASALTTAWE